MDKLTMIEKVVATMDAKEVRTLIVVCNDRLAALGEPVHQNAPKEHTPRKKKSYRSFYCKQLPYPCDDSMKTFKHVNTNWVNDIVKFGKPCLLTTKGADQKPCYMVVERSPGDSLELPNGYVINDVRNTDKSNKVFPTVFDAVANNLLQ